ncbi:MAG: hypothetical protein H7256_15340 [Bdellovibrio sp.]|nr:hypothetical protein [Bdellovibrio sp.]
MFNRLKKISLIVLFFYFVSMMIVMGNGSSFLGRYFESFYNPVANSIGLNTTWNFFSPDPAHTMYIKYDIYFEDAYGNQFKEPVESYYPASRDQGGDLRLDKKRSAYVMRFLIIDQSRIPQFFVPWMCAKNPGASKIFVEVILNRIPTLDQMMSVVNQNLKSYDNIVSTEEIGRSSYECPHAS